MKKININIIKIIGIKIGMSRFYYNNSNIPITLIKILDNKIFDIKNINEDLINFKVITDFKNKKFKKSLIGYFNKYNILPGKILYELNVSNKYIDIFKENESIYIDNLKSIKKVDITSRSKGKGFTGVIKRWNFKTQDASHGNSLSHRAPGSIGQNQSPGRVFKGKKMAGHYGNVNITIKNLKIIDFVLNDKILIIKGCIPGSNKSIISIKYNLI